MLDQRSNLIILPWCLVCELRDEDQCDGSIEKKKVRTWAFSYPSSSRLRVLTAKKNSNPIKFFPKCFLDHVLYSPNFFTIKFYEFCSSFAILSSGYKMYFLKTVNFVSKRPKIQQIRHELTLQSWDYNTKYNSKKIYWSCRAGRNGLQLS